MASYNLACAYTAAGRLDTAVAAVEAAVALNADLRANAARDPELAPVRRQRTVARAPDPGRRPVGVTLLLL
jgi:hypothetical protein